MKFTTVLVRIISEVNRWLLEPYHVVSLLYLQETYKLDSDTMLEPSTDMFFVLMIVLSVILIIILRKILQKRCKVAKIRLETVLQ